MTTRSTPAIRGSRQSPSFPLRAYFSHHKCATGWTGNILHEVCMHLNLTIRIVNQAKDFEKYGTLPSFVEHENVDFLVVANANRTETQALPLHRGFHVVRDPRDILVSAYFSHKNSHPTDEWPELRAHRERLQSVSKQEGLRLEMDFSRPFFEDMLTWDYNQENVLELHMEDLTQDPHFWFIRILRFLEMLDTDMSSSVRATLRHIARTSNRLSYKGSRFTPNGMPLMPAPRHRMTTLPVSSLESILQMRSFERLTGRRKGQENASSHLRKGVPGDWRNHFDSALVQDFKDRYNDLILTLGYESTSDWSLTPSNSTRSTANI